MQKPSPELSSCLRRVLLLVASFLTVTSRATAQMPFGAFSTRAAAMGGATMAVPDGLTSAVDNASGVGMSGIEAAVSGDVAVLESGELFSPLTLITGNDPLKFAAGLNPGSANDVKNALVTLSEPGNGLLGDARLGAIVSSKGWAFSFVDRAWSGVYARTDLVHVLSGFDPATSWKNNTSSAAFRGLEIKDVALTRSFSFLAGAISVGASAHALFGTTYTKEESVFTTDITSPIPFGRRSLSGTAKSETKFSFDAGALVTLGIVRIGGSVIAFNQPSFKFDDSSAAPAADRGEEVVYGRQGRIGASVKIPLLGLLAAVDYDVTKNATLVPDLYSQFVGGGVEFRIIVLEVRLGVKVNLASPDKTRVLSGGVGFVLGPVHADVGGIYRPGTNDVGISVAARFSM